MLILLALLGIIFGTASSLFGIGGGVFIVPTFEILYPAMIPQQIIPQSLLFIFFTSTYTSIQFFRIPQIRKDFRLGMILLLCTGMFLGGQIGKFLTNHISPPLMRLIFGYVLILLGLWSLIQIIFWDYFQRKKRQNPKEGDFCPPSLRYCLTLGISAGLISGLTGLGGGIVLVPVFTLLLSYPMSRASFFSNLCISFSGLINTGVNLYSGTVFHLNIILPLFLGCLLGVPLGIKLAMSLSKRVSLWAQCIFFLSLGLKAAL